MPKKKDTTEELIDLAKDVLAKMSVKADVVAKKEESHYRLDIASDDANLLIGFKGQTLSALEHLIRVLANEKKDEFISLSIDIGGYRAKRIEDLERQAKEIAWRVRQTQKSEKMPSMNSAERRHIHQVISDMEGVESISEGYGRDRRIIINPKK